MLFSPLVWLVFLIPVNMKLIENNTILIRIIIYVFAEITCDPKGLRIDIPIQKNHQIKYIPKTLFPYLSFIPSKVSKNKDTNTNIMVMIVIKLYVPTFN